MKRAGLGWKHPFSPHSRISQVPIGDIQLALCKIFARRNKPGSFRVDNGEPFAQPSTDTPTPLALWLIGLDIDMIWNKPSCPQMNGVVEHMQDTSQRWAEIERCFSAEQLQQRLEEEAHIQRAEFPVTRLKNQTRLQAFPNALMSNRLWQPEAPDFFNEQRVYDFLSKKIFTRKVSAGGQVTHFGKHIAAGKGLKGVFVQIRLACAPLRWEVYHDYKVLASAPADQQLSRQKILELSIFSKN